MIWNEREQLVAAACARAIKSCSQAFAWLLKGVEINDNKLITVLKC